jgi:alkanesulfonate monooxygenase SsuD/methylene tetrahydromethanopterin reductase-like flavin-dependent oxidoreductase (luciferase family)
MGVDFPRRWTQTREHILAMKKLWTEDEAGFDGKYVKFPKVWSYPKPVQKPHPPILIGGELDKAASRVADYGDGWLPRHIAVKPAELEAGRKRIEGLYRERGRNPAALDITLFGCRPNKEEVKTWYSAGANRILFVLRPEPARDTLQRIEKIAEVALV